MNSKRSTKKIDKFIKKNNIKMDEYPEKEYRSFNDFFTRTIIKEKRPYSKKDEDFISPCDSKLLVYDINEKTEMRIKGKNIQLKNY